MKKIQYITYFIVALITLNCTGSKIATNNSLDKKRFEKAKKDNAEVHTIEGAIFDLKGSYAEAILEYQEALKYDSSAGIHFAISKDYLKLNKLSSALEHAESASRLDPKNSDYAFLLANIYTAASQKDSAVAVYQNIIDNDSTFVQAYFNKAELIESKKPLEALELYNDLLDRIGPDWNVLLKIAAINERLGNVDKTVKTAEDLLEIDPSNIRLKKLLAESYLKLGRNDDALKIIDEALLSYPGDLNFLEFKAHTFINKNEWEKAADQYLKIISSKDMPSDSKVKIGKAFAGQSVIDTSIIPVAKRVISAIDKIQDDWQIKAFLGEIEEREGNDSLAINYYTQAAKLASWNLQIWTKLGILLFDNQMYAEATNELSQIVNNFPEEFVINIILGLSYSQQGKHADAEKYLEKSVKLNPNDLNALSAYGFTLNQLGKDDEALTYLNDAYKIDSNNLQVLGMLGMIYNSKENWERCDYFYEKAIAIDSTDALLLNNYAYSLSERGIQLERALRMSKKSLEADPENSSYLDTIGWIYFMMGKYDLAEKNIKKAVDIEPTGGTLLDHLGDVYFKQGKKGIAIKTWKKAIKMDDSLDKTKQKIEKGGL